MKRPWVLLLVPGGDASAWYAWLSAKLHDAKCPVVMRCLSTPLVLLRDDVDHNTILIGHRAGAAVALRLTEQAQVRGLVLVAPCVTGTLDGVEKIAHNCPWVVQLGAPDDIFVPNADQVALAQALHADFYFLPGRGQYTQPEAPDLWAILAAKLPDHR
ncbi:hypothetical protein ACHHYP_14576 [Achlya hypogyna]|uniref:Alpha/beta hydrolase n=1 Tax=Achlya hypogyna TaxID=1202772 RepID=A0A1V9YCW5_ACHHY|nr:hypothetical protein ACHHYP_14576 [Achlya hypogyna]